MTLDEVRQHYRSILNPPSLYFDVRNRKGGSLFPAGKPHEYYQPFIEHFQERAATAAAQAKRDARKGHTERATWYSRLATDWRVAATMALERQERSFLEGKLRAGSHQ